MSEENYYPLFRLLVERTRVLATVCDNAAEVLSEQFQDMITIPLAAVNDVLAKCPEAPAWDGGFYEDDIIIETFRHDAQRPGPPVSVKIRHVPTELSVESYSKQTAKENELVARKALAGLVQGRWEAELQAQEQGVATPTPRRRRSRA